MNRVMLAVVAAVSMSAAGAAMADPPAGDHPAGDRPATLAHRLTAEEIWATIPETAARRGVGGEAVVRCTITVQGSARDCHVLSESPAGNEFGAAAITTASQFIYRPAVRGGVAVASTVDIPIRFQRPAAAMDSHLSGESGFTYRMYNAVPWAAAPSFPDMLAAYPARARAEHVGGAVVEQCRIGPNGRLGDCDIIGEQPREKGFGAAARALLPRFRVAVDQTGAEQVAGGYVRVRITFPVGLLDAPQPALGRPHWSQLPTGDIPGSQYPRAAVAANVASGSVMLACTVGPDGRLTGCQAALETPPGYGFADAALAISTGFALPLWTEDGLPTVGAAVRVPVQFRLPPEDAASAAPPAAASR